MRTLNQIMRSQLDENTNYLERAIMTDQARLTSDCAFNEAIATGRLSNEMKSPLFAGNFMYMGFYNSKTNFKNITTRQYIA